MKKLLFSACALTLIALGYAGTAFAKDLRVGTCAKNGYGTIQAAVTAANAGDNIKVCPGTYTEQVTIPAGKDKLTLQSEKPLQAVIKAPAAMLGSKAIVQVTGSQDVKIREFTVAGPGGGGCDSIRYGVRVDGGGSATIEKNHITDIRDNPFSGCQNGVGILVGRNFEATTGSATIKENTIDQYQKGGIVVDNAGSDAKIEHNTVTGVGPTATIAQNGIQVSRGATADVKNNDVSGNVYTPQTFASTGMLVFGTGQVDIENNNLDQNDVGIYVTPAGNGSTIKNNDVTNSTFDGIAVVDSTQVSVSNNKVSNSEPGIGVYNTTDSQFSNNQVQNNRSWGIFADSTTGNNTFKDNKASGTTAGYAGPFDCEDDSSGGGTAGTANFWLNDKGATSLPAGICKP